MRLSMTGTRPPSNASVIGVSIESDIASFLVRMRPDSVAIRLRGRPPCQ